MTLLIKLIIMGVFFSFTVYGSILLCTWIEKSTNTLNFAFGILTIFCICVWANLAMANYLFDNCFTK